MAASPPANDKPKYTLAPWTVEQSDDRSAIAIVAGSRTIVEVCPTVSEDGVDFEFTDEDRANARLIAAAPDMLAALRQLNGFAKSASRLDYNEDQTLSCIAVVTANFDALIAKAEGY